MPPLPDRLRSKCRPRELQENPAHQRALSASLKFKDYPLRGGGVCVCLSVYLVLCVSYCEIFCFLCSAAIRLKPAASPAHLHTLKSQPRPEVRSQAVLFCAVLTHVCWEKTTLKGMKQPETEFFLIPIRHPPLGLGTLRHGNNKPPLPIRREQAEDGEQGTGAERGGGKRGRKI